MSALKRIIHFGKLVLIAVAAFSVLLAVILGVPLLTGYLDRSIADNRSQQLDHLQSRIDEFLNAVHQESGAEENIDKVKPQKKPVLICMSSNGNSSFGSPRHEKSIDFLTLDLPENTLSGIGRPGRNGNHAVLGSENGRKL